MFRRTFRASAFVVAAITISLTASVARAQDRYYMVMFAADGNPDLPRNAHTFASFIKVTEQAKVDKAKWPIEVHTISWLPASLNVRLISPPEKGVNLDLPATLKFEKSVNTSVFAWGPFEIRKELYTRALAQIKRLNSGAIAYKAADARFRPKAASNCFHAVSDIVDGPLLETGAAFGEPASKMVLQHLAPWIVEPSKIHGEIVTRLGVNGYPITFRKEVPAVVKKSK